MLFIHIGLHKAGSSSIQAFLSRNAQRLAEAGLAYPEAGRSTLAHHDLALSLGAGEISPAWAAVREAAGRGTTLLSSEAFCLVDPALLAEALQGVRPRILCWQRNAPEAVVSRYAQSTKRARNLEPFEVFFARHSEGEQLLIAPLLARWAELFGAEAIRVRSLEPEVLSGGELIADLLDAVGLADDPAYERPGSQNISPGWRALEIARALSREILGRGEVDERAQRFVSKALPRALARAELALGLYARGAYLDPAQAARMVELYNGDIGELERSGMDVRLKPIAAEAVAVTDAPLTEASIPESERLALLHAAMVELASEDFRNWR
jgi:hypothetical protein